MKIVSLIPSATEIVFALGMGDSLEGVTYDCDFPPEATKRPVVAESTLPQDRPLSPAEIDDAVGDKMRTAEPLYSLNAELIRQIQPDVILTQDLCRVCAVPSGHVEEALAKLGCEAEVVSLNPHSLSGIRSSIVTAGKALGHEKEAKALSAAMKKRIDAIKAESARLPAFRTLALEWPDPPWAGGHWIPEMVEIAGGTNLLGTKNKPSRRATWKEIADATPEVIVFMPCGLYLEEAEEEGRKLLDNPFFAATPAAVGGGIWAVDATSFFSRPGPRIVDGLEILAWAVHPEAFPEPPARTIARISR